MQRYGPPEHESLDVATDALQLAGALPMVYTGHVLLDDRPPVELRGDVVGGGADQLDAVLTRATVGIALRRTRAERNDGC